MYQVDFTILHSPVALSSMAVTPKKSNVSSLTENIDFDMSHSNETINGREDNQSEVLESSNDISNDSMIVLQEDMKYIGTEEWA
eukprot:4931071-Ditylum_brightwellii.AAC.1